MERDQGRDLRGGEGPQEGERRGDREEGPHPRWRNEREERRGPREGAEERGERGKGSQREEEWSEKGEGRGKRGEGRGEREDAAGEGAEEGREAAGVAFRGKGPWTPEEDQELVAFVEQYGARHWRKAPRLTRLTRDAQSCRLRWTSHLSPHVSHPRPPCK